MTSFPLAYRSNRTVLAIVTAMLVPLALVGCGSRSESDKAAAPLPGAFEALGLHAASWARASLDGDGIVLLDVRADLDGVGAIHAAQVTVRKFKETEGGWQADLVSADTVDGAARARRIVVNAPRARRDAGAWRVQDEGRTLESYEGPLRGVPVSLRSANLGPAPRMPGRPDATQMAASGLRLTKATQGIPPAVSDLEWDVSVRSEIPRPGAAFVEVQQAEAKGWSLRGRLAFVGGAGLAAELADLKPNVLTDLARWPDGVLLEDADLDLSMARPEALFGTEAWDPVTDRLAAETSSGYPVSWHVRIHPPRPVPVRTLPGILAGKGADAALGLDAQVRKVVTPSLVTTQQPDSAAPDRVR